jgi:hypothetical protein
VKRLFKRVALASFFLVFLVLMLLNARVAVSQTSARMAVTPKFSSKPVGEFFSVNLTASDVSELFLWQFNMSFNPAVLQAVSVVEGPFLKQAGNTMRPDEPLINNSTGLVLAGWALFPYPEHGASGDGVLATVTFKVIAEGQSQLQFIEKTRLRTWDANEGVQVNIDTVFVSGSFGYPPEIAAVHDVAVENLATSSRYAVPGDKVTLNVTVTNMGNIAESFDVSLTCNSSLVDEQSVTELAPEVSQNLVFTWDTKDVAIGDYLLAAAASSVSGETRIADNDASIIVHVVKASSPMIPLEFLIVAVAAVAVIAASGLFYLNRRK